MPDPDNSRRIMELEIGEIIKDIAAGDAQQANEQFGPYTDMFNHMRRHLLDEPFNLRLADPLPFVRRMSEATSVEDAMRYLTRILVSSYLRKRRDDGAVASRGWWDRIIAAVETEKRQIV